MFIKIMTYHNYITYVVPDGAPQNLSVLPISPFEAYAWWSPPHIENQNGIIQMYILNVTEVASGEEFQLSTYTTSITIDGLRPYHLYTCAIAAGTTVGVGPFSSIFVFLTHEYGIIIA